jgi:2-polyprenyl-3-methyl-5-hydroxy-6-metoxy-1,4-benzoquinol methylase
MPTEEEYSGHSNLELDAQSHRFTEWLYREVSAGLKGDVLEIGSGMGTYSEKIIRDKSPVSRVMLTDIAHSYIEALTKRYSFTSNNNVSVSKLDLNRKEDYEKIGYEKFDSILGLNVLEHIENDEFALQQLYRMLKEDGTMVLLVPCHKFLYNILDKKAGHFRRYTRRELEHKVSKTRFTIQRIFYFNMLGIVGWYLNGGLAKNPQINSTAYRLFDSLVPLSEHAEKLIGRRLGLSIICYLRKEQQKRTFSQ